MNRELQEGLCHINKLLEGVKDMVQQAIIKKAALQKAATTISHPAEAPQIARDDTKSIEEDEEGEEDVIDIAKLNVTKGAIFDYLYRRLKTPQDVTDAFTNGFAGCPPINSMEARGSEYAQSWRAGAKRYKMFCVLRTVNKTIEAQPVKNRRHYTSIMHMKYTGKPHGALSTLTSRIT